ncbi:hypothetical protein EPIR_0679 [Erwinia piriflorinigrans CFBP 5888]|uniref:Uncharacterized protein n=1 Tax=Erwinia piriflorinigrans CFBP 5888 TaxID=1161919 RepID=V5Z4W9_9GAMM|nr:hypothetical protein EPIR_0679 [Erwinia piriflorinigrans CFBP 5888]
MIAGSRMWLKGMYFVHSSDHPMSVLILNSLSEHGIHLKWQKIA